MANKLKAITTRAKQLYKTGRYKKWTDAIKAASKQIGAVKIVQRGESRKTPQKKTYLQTRKADGTFKGYKRIAGVSNISSSKKSTKMARRKHRRTSTTTHHRRRRHRSISGIGGNTKGMLMTALQVTGGAVASKFAANIIEKKAPNLNPKMVALVQFGIAAFLLPKVIKGQLGNNLAMGMMSVAGIGLLSATGVLHGIGADDEYLRLSGASDMLEIVSGANEDDMSGLPEVSGVDEEMGDMEDY